MSVRSTTLAQGSWTNTLENAVEPPVKPKVSFEWGIMLLHSHCDVRCLLRGPRRDVSKANDAAICITVLEISLPRTIDASEQK
jgi:hypothetical protein